MTGLHGRAEFQNPDNLPLDIYARMYETDETVQACVDFVVMTVFDQLGEYKNPNDRAQKYLDEFWDHCQISEEHAVTETLFALVMGFSCQERIPEFSDGKIWLEDFPAVDQIDLKIHLNTVKGSRDYGRVAGITQDFSMNPDGAIIDASRLAIFTHRGRNGNAYGLSRCKAAYKHWVIKDVLLQAGAAGMERYGVPLAIGKCPDPLARCKDSKGKETTEGAALLAALKELAAAGIIVIRGGKDNQAGCEIELVEPAHPIAEQFRVSTDQSNKLIMRAMLLPSLMMEPTDIGSFALGSKHFELFLRMVARLAIDIRRHYHRHVYAPLLAYNFGPKIARQGFWEYQETDEERIKLLAETFYTAFTAGYMRPDVLLEDANWMRSKVGAPEWKTLPPPKATAAPPTSGVTDPSLQPPADSKPGTPRAAPRTPSKPQGRPKGNA